MLVSQEVPVMLECVAIRLLFDEWVQMLWLACQRELNKLLQQLIEAQSPWYNVFVSYICKKAVTDALVTGDTTLSVVVSS